MFDTVANMIAQDFFFKATQRGPDSGDLRHDVDAVAILFDHAGKPADLPLDLRQALCT